MKKVETEEQNHIIVTERGCVLTCSNCHERLEYCYPDGTEVRHFSYCPHCGCKFTEVPQ